jgi:NADH:ubiquinone oxidoreductase subunit 3 (subunit A)
MKENFFLGLSTKTNNFFFLEYRAIAVFLVVSLCITLLFLVLSYMFTSQTGGTEKLSAYECGFEPFEDARNTFDIKFYIFAILFIIFDIEVLFLLPWTVVSLYSSSFSFWVVVDFIIELVIGYIYIWKKGCLDI